MGVELNKLETMSRYFLWCKQVGSAG